jgi:hypothetical protein
VTEKHIPGAGWVYTVYNNIDQPILSQDARQQAESTWIFTKYDALGRVVMTGSVSSSASRSAMQSTADGQTTLWEIRDGLNGVSHNF